MVDRRLVAALMAIGLALASCGGDKPDKPDEAGDDGISGGLADSVLIALGHYPPSVAEYECVLERVHSMSGDSWEDLADTVLQRRSFSAGQVARFRSCLDAG